MTDRSPIIYVVDDDVSVCRALAVLLESHNFRVHTFTGAAEFLAFKRPRVTSCLVLDLSLPHMNGLDLQKTMASQALTMPVIFISGQGDIPKSVKAMKGGAVDFLPKPFTEKELLDAIARAIRRDKIQNKEQAEVAKIKRLIKTLSPREMEVFRFVAQGMLSKQIAAKRGTALQTIKVHRARVMRKLQAKTFTELVHLARKAGIIPSAD